jgi:hypothetical protein
VLEPATPRDAHRLSWAVEHRPPCTSWWRVREGYNIIRSARQYLDRILRNSSLACEAHPLPVLDGKGLNIVDDDHHARSRAARWELPSGINPQRRYGLELELVADHDVAATAAAAAAAAAQQQAAARKQQAARLASTLPPPPLPPRTRPRMGMELGMGMGERPWAISHTAHKNSASTRTARIRTRTCHLLWVSGKP